MGKFLEGWQEDIISTKEFEIFTMPSSTIKTLVCDGSNSAAIGDCFGIKRISTGVREVTNTCRSTNRLLLDDCRKF